MTGSRGSDYVRSPFHFPPLLFFIVTYSQVFPSRDKDAPINRRVISPQHRHPGERESCLPGDPETFQARISLSHSLASPWACDGDGMG